MITLGTRLEVADNSGAKEVECIHVDGGSVVRWANVGGTITVVVKKALPAGKVLKAQVHKAIIVRTKKQVKRRDGSTVSFENNAAVIINKKGEPIGTRVFGPVAREIRERGYIKIASLAPEVL